MISIFKFLTDGIEVDPEPNIPQFEDTPFNWDGFAHIAIIIALVVVIVLLLILWRKVTDIHNKIGR